MEGVVDALVGDGCDPVVLLAEFADLGDFPGGVIGDAEAFEFACLWHFLLASAFVGFNEWFRRDVLCEWVEDTYLLYITH